MLRFSEAHDKTVQLPLNFCAAPGPLTSPDSLEGAFGALGAFALVYSSIGAIREDNTDTISARQVSVGLICGGQQFFGAGCTHRASFLALGLHHA